MTYAELLQLINSTKLDLITDSQKQNEKTKQNFSKEEEYKGLLGIDLNLSKEEEYEGLLKALDFVHRVCKSDYDEYYKINGTISTLDFAAIKKDYEGFGSVNPYVKFIIANNKITHSLENKFSLTNNQSCYSYELIKKINKVSLKVMLVHGVKYVKADSNHNITEGCKNIVMLKSISLDRPPVETYYDLVENPSKVVDLKKVTCHTIIGGYKSQC